MATILDLLENAATHASEVSFVPAQQPATSFADLWQDSEQAAAHWSRWPSGASVGGLLTPSAAVIASMVGAWRAGLRFVSLPLPGRAQDAKWYREQIEAIARVARLDAIVVDDRYAATLPQLTTPVLGASTCRSAARRGARLHDVGELVQFSSGTSGAPKGICLSLEAVAAAVLAQIEALAIRPGDVSCFWVPLAHDFGLVGGLLTSWGASSPRWLGGARGRYVCIDPVHFMMQPWSWLNTCARVGATITGGPAFGYALATRFIERLQGSLHDLRACIVGAEPIDVDVLGRFSALAGRHGLSEHSICPAYGLAEATLAVTMHRPGDAWQATALSEDEASRHDVIGLDPRRRVVCVGKPVGQMEVEARGGVIGEIHVRGPSLMTGYLGEDASVSADGWIATGDLGFVRQQGLYVVGRQDAVLVIAGKNASAVELEAIAERHPLVRAGNCAVCPDGKGRYLLAVEHKPGDATNGQLESLPQELRAQLAQAIGIGPAGVVVLAPGSLPKTSSGKLQRNLLRARWPLLRERAIASS